MRRPSLNSFQFIKGDPSSITNLSDLVRYVQDMEARVSAALELLATGHRDMIFAMPAKPDVGDVYYFDGILSNPGSGEGFYYYNSSGQWIQLG